jgi:hypothetical protein
MVNHDVKCPMRYGDPILNTRLSGGNPDSNALDNNVVGALVTINAEAIVFQSNTWPRGTETIEG